jgi:two-component system, sensor histidine kinase
LGFRIAPADADGPLAASAPTTARSGDGAADAPPRRSRAWLDPALSEHILAAQVRWQYRGSQYTALAAAGVAMVFWFAFHGLTGDRRVFVWAAFVHSAQALRFVNALLYQRARARGTGIDSRHWLNRHYVLLAVTALGWGSAAALLWPTQELPRVAFVMLLLLGMGAGGVSAFVASRTAIYLWLVPLTLPLVAVLALQQGPHAGALATIVLVYLLANLAFALNHNSMLTRALVARYENAELVEQLRHQMELVATANREKSRFLASASHDLRQPLHALTLFATALDKRLVGTDAAPLMQNLNDCIGSLDRSFNAMLDVSRLDAGVVEPSVLSFPLRDVFRRLHMHFAGQAEASGLHLRFKPGGKVVATDPQLLERILGNLIQNAIKYTKSGGIVVVARDRAHSSAREGARAISIEVWDTGVGIADKQLPRVFDEFYQVDNPGHDRSRGLGMGLAIVKRLALLLRHPLEVHSRVGRGTMFRLVVPRAVPVAENEADTGADTVPSPDGNAGTLLIIDDEQRIRDSMSLLLAEWGYRTLLADSIAQACEVAQSTGTPIDAIVSDLRLRDGEDGLAAIDAVCRLQGRQLPALLVTGDTDQEQIKRVHDSGHKVLFKPVRAKELYAALRQLQ